MGTDRFGCDIGKEFKESIKEISGEERSSKSV